MKNFRKAQSGFTLIELLVVMIIVAILVAVGISLLQGNVRRAKFTEADSGLGTVRTHMRSRLAEHGSYVIPAVPTLANIGIRGRQAGPPVIPGDLDGRFFSEEAYSIPASAATTFCAAVTGINSVLGTLANGIPSVRANEVNTAANPFNRSMDQNGTIFTDIACTAGNEVN